MSCQSNPPGLQVTTAGKYFDSCTWHLGLMCSHVCRAKTTGEGAGWIGGVPGRNDVVQTWLCQPGGNTPCPSIADATTCPADQLKASLQCPDPSCNAKAVSHHLHLQIPRNASPLSALLLVDQGCWPLIFLPLPVLGLWQSLHSVSQCCLKAFLPGVKRYICAAKRGRRHCGL